MICAKCGGHSGSYGECRECGKKYCIPCYPWIIECCEAVKVVKLEEFFNE